MSDRGLLSAILTMLVMGLLPAGGRAQGPEGGLGAADRLRQLLERNNYVAFHQDTVLTAVEPGRDVIFVRANGEIDTRIEGSVVILDGELGLRSGATVTGDVILLHSQIFRSRQSTLEGRELADDSPQAADLLLRSLEPISPGSPLPFRVEVVTNRMGGFRLEGYDRVDGLSLSWGFGLNLPEMNDFQFLQARLIAATVRQAIGFETGLVFPLDETRRTLAGFEVRSRTDTHDRWRMDDLENAVRTLFDGSDDRYYFRREGYTAYLRRWFGQRSRIGLAFQDERYYSLNKQSPFTLFEESFHPNRPIDPGSIQSLTLETLLDSRNDPYFTLSGFRFEQLAELAGGTLGGEHAFTRLDLSLERWDTFRTIHSTYFRAKWAWADTRLPFQRGYTLGNTLGGYDPFAFSGDRMLVLQARYGMSLPRLPLVEYLFFRWRADAVFQSGTAFFKAEPGQGYDDLKHDIGAGFTGETLIGRVGFHIFRAFNAPAKGDYRLLVSLQMNPLE